MLRVYQCHSASYLPDARNPISYSVIFTHVATRKLLALLAPLAKFDRQKNAERIKAGIARAGARASETVGPGSMSNFAKNRPSERRKGGAYSMRKHSESTATAPSNTCEPSRSLLSLPDEGAKLCGARGRRIFHNQDAKAIYRRPREEGRMMPVMAGKDAAQALSADL